MKKLLLIGILALACMREDSFAQTTPIPPNKTDAAFSMDKEEVRNKHIVFLEKGNRIVVELHSRKDYDMLDNFDAVLKSFLNDISFYRDSLESMGADNVRIDYAAAIPAGSNKIRFKRYSADGDAYFTKNGNTSKLKLEQDTIRIVLSKDAENNIGHEDGNGMYKRVQVTFILNNYTDINDLISTKEINRYIDSLIEKSEAKVPLKKGANDQSTIYYHPYSHDKSNFLKRYMLLAQDDDKKPGYASTYDYLTVNLDIGGALVKNKIAPAISFGPEIKVKWKGWNTAWGRHKEYSVYGINAAAYYLFDKQPDGKYRTNINWFINAEYGSTYGKNSSMGISRWVYGVGYLLNPDNINFQKNTFKLFMNAGFRNGIRIQPEMIFTNNFKNVLPGIGISFSCFNNN